MTAVADKTNQHVADLEKNGFTIIPNALSPVEVEATIRAVKEVLAAEDPIWKSLGVQTANLSVVHVIHAKHPLFYEFFLNPPVMQVVRRMIGDDCILNDSNVRVPLPTGARNRRQGFQNHVDREDYSVVPFFNGRHYPMAMNVTWTLVDFTIENGATLMWPGSHLSCQIPDPESFPPGHVYAEAPAGSAVIWDTALWHAGGVNQSSSPRYSVLAYYIRSWMKGRLDSLRCIPPEVRPQLSIQARNLLGLSTAPPDYSEVKALSPEQLAALNFDQKRALGFAVY